MRINYSWEESSKERKMDPPTASSLRHSRTVPGNPQQTNVALKPNLHQQIQNTSKFLIISLTSRHWMYFWVLYFNLCKKNPTQLITKDLLYEMAHKVVNQHKNTAWAIPSQFRLYLHMHIFYYCTALIFSFTPHWTDILGPQKKKKKWICESKEKSRRKWQQFSC